MNQELTEMVAALIETSAPGPADCPDKPGDPGDERARRQLALGRVGAGLAVRAEVHRAADTALAEAAATAVWLGASLADLAAVTGHSRQAVRKQWPGLGDIHRRRAFLRDHRDDLLTVAELVHAARKDLRPRRKPAGFDAAAAELGRGAARARAEFAPDATEGAADATRWLRLDRLIDEALREAVATAGDPRGPEAEFALAGATGTLIRYDAATTE